MGELRRFYGGVSVSGPLTVGGTTTMTGGAVRTQETLITTRVLTMADSGKTFFLDLVGGFTVSLPLTATSAGFYARFYVKTAPTTAYIIQTSASEETLACLIFSGAGADEDSELGFTGTNINFVASTAVINDSCEVECGAAGWYCKAYCNATGGITVTG